MILVTYYEWQVTVQLNYPWGQCPCRSQQSLPSVVDVMTCVHHEWSGDIIKNIKLYVCAIVGMYIHTFRVCTYIQRHTYRVCTYIQRHTYRVCTYIQRHIYRVCTYIQRHIYRAGCHLCPFPSQWHKRYDICTYNGTCIHTLWLAYTHKLSIVINCIYSICTVMQCLWWGLIIVRVFIIFSKRNEISIDNV